MRKRNLRQQAMKKPETVVYGGIKFYPCLYSGRWYLRSASRPGKLLHRAIWEAANGEIPPGFHIHHRNNDSTDNRLENLDVQSKAAHFLTHHDPSLSGRKGGKAGTGKAKARTSEQARAAVNARWKNYRDKR